MLKRLLLGLPLILVAASSCTVQERPLFTNGQHVTYTGHGPGKRKLSELVIDSLRTHTPRKTQVFYAVHSIDGMLHIDLMPQNSIKPIN